ncbi:MULTISPECIES: hypothetical protein [unclassified Streptomyces]|uniref:hypothetical protein n=1 Tax=unclassified Streptomyces TaxID=2593676 RepID=UPI0011CD4135|nr:MULTISPECIES: hypothetical protein [unclassified Streptomyces]TXS72591.1 hypothetical protein EAO69_15140 [Streptomyces sp. me109]
MNQRKDTYRAALQREPGAPSPRPLKITRLDARYVRLTIEVDPAVPREFNRWVVPPVSALLRVGAAVLRPLRNGT